MGAQYGQVALVCEVNPRTTMMKECVGQPLVDEIGQVLDTCVFMIGGGDVERIDGDNY